MESRCYGRDLAYNGEKINEAQGRLLTPPAFYNEVQGNGGHRQGDGGFSHLPATQMNIRSRWCILSQPAPGGWVLDRY